MEDPFLDPARWIVSNDLAAALRDRYPVSPGHTLIVPRRPVSQTIFHAHVHLIPRYRGDHPNPRGGVRQIIPGKGLNSDSKCNTFAQTGRGCCDGKTIRAPEP